VPSKRRRLTPQKPSLESVGTSALFCAETADATAMHRDKACCGKIVLCQARNVWRRSRAVSKDASAEVQHGLGKAAGHACTAGSRDGVHAAAAASICSEPAIHVDSAVDMHSVKAVIATVQSATTIVVPTRCRGVWTTACDVYLGVQWPLGDGCLLQAPSWLEALGLHHQRHPSQQRARGRQEFVHALALHARRNAGAAATLLSWAGARLGCHCLPLATAAASSAGDSKHTAWCPAEAVREVIGFLVWMRRRDAGERF
jgi:hypothetical protein